MDLGISRTQDLQNPLKALPINPQVRRIPEEGRDRDARQRVNEVNSPPRSDINIEEEAREVDLEIEVQRLNRILGAHAQVRFALTRSGDDIHVAILDRQSDHVLKTIPTSELPDIARKILGGGGFLVDNRS